MSDGEVERIASLFKSQGGKTFWWSVKLKKMTEPFMLHQNWMASHGGLKPGDHVRYVISKAKLEQDGTQGTDRKGTLLFEELRKVEKEEGSREELEVNPGL